MGMTQGDSIEAALNATETTETSLGNVTVPLGAKNIVGVYGIGNVLTTTAEIASGKFRFVQAAGPGGKHIFPLQVNQGPAGTLAAPGWSNKPEIIPVSIACRENDTIACYAVLDVAQTGTCRARVGFIFE